VENSIAHFLLLLNYLQIQNSFDDGFNFPDENEESQNVFSLLMGEEGKLMEMKLGMGRGSHTCVLPSRLKSISPCQSWLS
jgi:hypothetical protein